ncbi:type IV pilus modification PilV family protein [Hydrogenimonas urashimensis]|uniref:type IV pilus modification PilV family protein n=1 Tax=Hydrogenimonas urashimensis TaxID=2740515 RepID=UPI0019154EAE|nr:type II secretion system protein [Hydrogenimonas urashimensis]
MRRGFTLLSAIFLMVLVATLMVLAYSLSAQTKKQTGDIYMQEQAQLLARSATEFALLAVSGHDNTADCIDQINLRYPQGSPVYDINMTLYYIGNGLPCSHILANGIATAESNGTILIDTSVSYTIPDSNEKVRFFRRTIQKP